MNAQPSPAAARAIAEYEAILANYQTESARLTAQGIDPSLDPHVLELYQESVAAHGRIAEAYALDAAAAAPTVTPVAAASVPSAQAQPAAAPAGATPGPAARNEAAAPTRESPDPLSDFDLSQPEPIDSPVAAVPHPEQGGVLGRRPGIERFLPPPPDSSAPLRRDVLAAARTDARPQLSRERKIAGTLPDWSPEPPNEVLQVSPRR